MNDINKMSDNKQNIEKTTKHGGQSKYNTYISDPGAFDCVKHNACVAAANGKIDEAAPLLIALLDDDSPLVRGHAARTSWLYPRPGQSDHGDDIYHGASDKGELDAETRRIDC